MIFKARELNLNDVVILDNYGDDREIIRLTEESYINALKNGIEFEGVPINDDILSKNGFNVTLLKGVQTYIFRYEDVMLTAVYNDDETIMGYAVINSVRYDAKNDKTIIDVIEGIRPLVYINELQALLRVYDYREFADKFEY